MYSLKAREEEIKSRVREDYFGDYDCSNYLGNIDFSVAMKKVGFEKKFKTEYLLWAEAKRATDNIYEALVQLIFTIGKEKTFDYYIPPKFLGAFNAEQIVFIPFSSVMEVFALTDFDWTIAPSNHESKEFKHLKELVHQAIDTNQDGVFRYFFGQDEKELRKFIKSNFTAGSTKVHKIRISKNNFVHIYNQWREKVAPTIDIPWGIVKKNGLLDAHFYLADIMSQNNCSIMKKLHVLLETDHYDIDKRINPINLYEEGGKIKFKDNMAAHREFWSAFERPPKKEYQEFIAQRIDLLVPQDIRKTKGSYFTPDEWVIKAQDYLASVYGENWQEEYYVWDCCAGTGNLLVGLNNPKNIWASELIPACVKIMYERIDKMGTGSNLFHNHVFQFDFLNDHLLDREEDGELKKSKVPQELQEIIKDPEERKKLIILINPPYKEASDTDTISKKGKNAKDVAKNNLVYKLYKDILGKSAREVYVQFFTRIYQEMEGCILAEFSTLKILQASNYEAFRNMFQAKLEKLFICPSYTFDNVNGRFPIGFYIWDTGIKEKFNEIVAEIYDEKNTIEPIGYKKIIVEDGCTINSWLKDYVDSAKEIAAMSCKGTDFQNNKFVNINHNKYLKGVGNAKGITRFKITKNNIKEAAVYFSTRLAINSTWLNNRDQFFRPFSKWKEDTDFQSDCLAFMLFNGQVKLSHENGVNHFIPFTEQELDIQYSFESHIMSDYIKGIYTPVKENLLFNTGSNSYSVPKFTPAAQNVMEAGRKIWYYYLHHRDSQLYGSETLDINYTFYDIRKYFQGVDEKGKMNSDSSDQEYMRLIKDLREKQKVLAKQIEEKVYKYGFLYNGEPREDDDIVEVEAEEVVTPAVVKKEVPIKKKNKEQTIIVQNIQVNGDLNVQTLIGSADIKK